MRRQGELRTSFIPPVVEVTMQNLRMTCVSDVSLAADDQRRERTSSAKGIREPGPGHGWTRQYDGDRLTCRGNARGDIPGECTRETNASQWSTGGHSSPGESYYVRAERSKAAIVESSEKWFRGRVRRDSQSLPSRARLLREQRGSLEAALAEHDRSLAVIRARTLVRFAVVEDSLGAPVSAGSYGMARICTECSSSCT